MEHEEQLAWEARAGKPAAAAAFAAALLSFVSGIYLQAAIGGTTEADEYLREAERQPADFILTGVLLALASLLIIPVLAYLYRATRYRLPTLMPASLYLAGLGAATIAVVAVWRYVELPNVAEDFFPYQGQDADEDAEDAIREALPPAAQGLGLGGTVALAFAVVMISLNAMRAGLLSRFMGVIGIFIGVLYVIPLGVQVLQLFWFAALGLLFLGRWPGGRGPAWQTGEATPWPGAAEQRAEMERRRAEAEGVVEPEAPAEPPEPEHPRRASRKRRKKRR